MVVEPRSTASPKICSFSPGHSATSSSPSRTAAVTCHFPLRRVGCMERIRPKSVCSPVSPHCCSSASWIRPRSELGSCMSGSRTVIKCRRTVGSMAITRSSADLRTTCL